MYYRGTYILHHNKKLLQNFWDYFGHKKNGLLTSRKIQSPRSQNEVIAALIKMGEVWIIYKSKSAHDCHAQVHPWLKNAILS